MSKKLKRLILSFSNKGVDVSIPWRLSDFNTSWIRLIVYDKETKKVESEYFLESSSSEEIVFKKITTKEK